MMNGVFYIRKQFSAYIYKLYLDKSLKLKTSFICENKIYFTVRNIQFNNIKHNFNLTEI